MKRSVFILLLTVLSLFSCHKTNRLPDPKPINLNEKAAKMVTADNQFGLELFKQLADTGFAVNNLMISPLSVSQALSMTYNGANGQTKTAFDQTLHFEGMSLADVNQSAHELTGALLTVDPKVVLEIANSIWYKQGFTVESNFVQQNQTYYDASVNALDFNNPQSVNTINSWVDEHTNHKISKIVNQLNPQDRMLLINAVYFKGDWRNQFNKSTTQSAPFHLENGVSVNVQMMHATGKYPIYENDMIDALEMPYGRGNFSMVVLLPREGYRVQDVLDSLNADVWNLWEDGFIPMEDVPVSFPKFEFRYEKSLNRVLSTLGLSNAFSDVADFSGISKQEKLLISNVQHKTYIKVDEEGTEAASVTSVTVFTKSAGPGMPFVADHPFVFLIKEKYTHAILFIGVVANPND